MTDGFPVLNCHYSRLSRLSFGTAFLILGYGGVGMVTGLIATGDNQRLQQILIGLCFLALAGAFGFAFVQMIRAIGRSVLTLDNGGLWDRRLTTAAIPLAAIARIENIEPSFLERLIIPSGRNGRILIHIQPDWWDRLSLRTDWVTRMLGRIFAGRGRLRLFHKTLDIPYLALIGALEQAVESTQKNDTPPQAESAERADA